jgi:ATP-dependent RNA helicase RhlE
MKNFRTGKFTVLVATDLASRGIDVQDITHIINYDIPEDPEVYVHRVGRTARMGATGKAFTFVAHGEAQLQTEIEKLINSLMGEYKIPGFVASSEPGSRRIGEGHPQQPGSPAGPGAPGTAPAPAQPEEGYSATSFANVNLTKAVRPISGKYPTRRRR